MTRKKYLLLTAGGSGTRMGGPVPKQFMELGVKAVLHVTIDRFIHADPEIRVITVLPENYIPFWRDYCASRNLVVRQTLVKGGISRFHSVRNALSYVPDGALVAVHDGVRPLVSTEFISRMFRLAEEVPALVPVVASVDTIRALERTIEDDGTVRFRQLEGIHPDRSILFRVQTPQIFHSEVLKAAYSLPYEVSFTDDASVVERYGVPISFADGEQLNIKITTPPDLKLAEAVLSEWK